MSDGAVLRRPTAVMFGSYDEFRHPRVAVLREGLVDAGWDVTVVNEPLGASTADKVAAARSPFAAARFVGRVLRSWALLWARGRRVPAPDVVVVGYLGHLDVHLARLLWRRSELVLDHLVGLADTVRDRGLDTGATYRLLDLVDRAAVARADVVVVDTDEQLAQLPESAQRRAVVVPVGAAHLWFEQTAPPPPPPLRVCFVGLFTPLHGAPVIGRALAILHDRDVPVDVSMVGTGQDLASTRCAAGPAAAQVNWIDWVDAEDLPAFVASHHVSLGIFGTTPKALRVVPTKVYQGVAAGTTVVTSDTAPQRRALGDAAVYVPPGDASALADVLSMMATGDHSIATAEGVADRFAPRVVLTSLLDRLDHPLRGPGATTGGRL